MRPAGRRIAFVSDAVWPFNKGGKERRLHEISTRLAAAGYEVHVYTMHWWQGGKTIELEGVTFHAIAKLRPLYARGRRSIVQALAFGLATLKMVTKDFDVLDVDHMPYFPLFTARVVCSVRRRPLLTTWHEYWGRAYWVEYMGWTGVMGHLAERLAVRMPDDIVAVSEHTSQRVREHGSREPAAVVTNGVDLAALAAATPSGQASDVMFAGRLLDNKRVDLLIRAIALARKARPEIRCVIVGEGPERGRLERLTTELGLSANVTFLGFVADVYGLMKSSRVFVLPSVREGFGLVAIEANVCGLPVLTSRHPDNATRLLIHEGENGYLVDGSAEDLAEKILRVLSDREPMDTRRVAVEGRSIASDWAQVVGEVEAIFAAYVDVRSFDGG